MASINEVAARAGVSIATVSRVLNNHPRVKPHLRERVLQAINELGYQPSGIARNMRSQSLRVIGLIITDIQNPFFTSLVRAVEDVAYENQHTVLLCNSDEDIEKERLYVDVLSRERVAGVIVIPTGREHLEPLRNLRVPIVVADRKLPGLVCDTVVIDNRAGAYAATDHLIRLGHRRIGLVCAPLGISVGRERREGYEDALRDHGIAVDETLIRVGDLKQSGGLRAAQELLSLASPPTAIFSVNNLMTLGTFQVVQERGMRIPDDISLVGFDDMPWFPLLSPPLTSVRQPTYQIGAEAARLLFRRLREQTKAPSETLVLQPEFILRNSTAPRRENN